MAKFYINHGTGAGNEWFSGLEDPDEVISFGTFGHYGPWEA